MRHFTIRPWRTDPTRPGGGCVPHLPAPGCPPDRPMELERACFPLRSLVRDLTDLARTSPDPTRKPKR